MLFARTKLMRRADATAINFNEGVSGNDAVQDPNQDSFDKDAGFIRNATNAGIIPIPTASSMAPVSIKTNKTAKRIRSLR